MSQSNTIPDAGKNILAFPASNVGNPDNSPGHSPAGSANARNPDYLNDARLLTPLDLSAPELQEVIKITTVAHAQSKRCRSNSMTWVTFLGLLSTHVESPKKDGPGIVLGALAGNERRKTAVTAIYALGLDIDTGVPGERIDAAMVDFGHLCVRYSTHSHGKKTTRLAKDKLTSWCGKYGLEVDQASIRRFLREETRWESWLVDTVTYEGDDHGPDGLMAVVNHAPMPKHRIIVPLTEPFEPAKAADTHAAGLAMVPPLCDALSRALGDLPHDRAARDPARLFFLPRHAPGRPYEASVCGGPLLDWRDLDLTAPATFETALAKEFGGGSRSTTPEGKALGKWSSRRAQGFQIVDVLRDHAEEKIRTNGTAKVEIVCPFDENHSNPGDPEDRACFAVNAGEGLSDIFTIKCLHDSCSSRTNNDHLGKMVADGWFPEDVLESDVYNAALDDGEAAPGGYDAVLEMISALGSDPHPDALKAVYAAMAGLTDVEITSAKRTLKKATGIGVGEIAKGMRALRRSAAQTSGLREDADGVRIFEYSGDWDFQTLVRALREVTLSRNDVEGERLPIVTCEIDRMMKMTRDAHDAVTFAPLARDDFQAASNESLNLVRLEDDGAPGPRKPLPLDVVKTVYHRAAHHLPPTPEIVRTPIHAGTGELLIQDGWRPDLALYLEQGSLQVPAISAEPAAEEVAEALSFLRGDLLKGFPFLDFDGAGVERRGPSEAHALAMLLTPFARRLFEGHRPVFWVSKPTPGTGGTKLGGMLGRIMDGRPPVPMAYAAGNDAENEKRLIAAALERRTILFFDDVKRFDSRPIIQAVTSHVISGRLLGGNDLLQAPNNFLIIGGGNNTFFGPEMGRRVVTIRLNAKTADLASREFSHDAENWVVENRAEIIWALLTLVQNWIAQDRPKFTTRRLVSFEGWSETVGGILQAAGVEGFLDVAKSLEVDPAYGALRRFVTRWFGQYGHDEKEVRDLVNWAIDSEQEIVEGRDEAERRRRLQAALSDLTGQTFDIGVNGSPAVVTVERSSSAEGLIYKLAPVEERGK